MIYFDVTIELRNNKHVTQLSYLQGRPMFVRKSDQTCLYEFLWVTSAACPVNVKKDVVSDNCKAVNPQTNVEFDLNVLRNTIDDYTVRDEKNNRTYYVNVCGPLQNSRGQFICMLRLNVIPGLETLLILLFLVISKSSGTELLLAVFTLVGSVVWSQDCHEKLIYRGLCDRSFVGLKRVFENLKFVFESIEF